MKLRISRLFLLTLFVWGGLSALTFAYNKGMLNNAGFNKPCLNSSGFNGWGNCGAGGGSVSGGGNSGGGNGSLQDDSGLYLQDDAGHYVTQ